MCHNQHGFRKGLSTSTAIFEYVQFLYDNYDKCKSSSSVFIDYSRAFDTIDHEILLSKLELYGLDNQSLKWFKSYLTGRKQMTRVDGHVSTLGTVKMGVPQGSILGPFLFIVYINDLISVINKNRANILLYADETIIYSAASEAAFAIQQNQDIINEVCNWCFLNRLSINTKKTKHMLVMSRKDVNVAVDVQPHVYMDNIKPIFHWNLPLRRLISA